MAPHSITSAVNPLLKEIRKAQRQGGVTAHGWLIAEGPHLAEEAARSGLRIRCAVISAGFALNGAVRPERIVTVTPTLFRSISGTETPQGVLILAEPPEHTVADLYKGISLIAVLDGVQDPGNAGAIARSAEAFGASGAVFIESANPLNPKTLRASAGSLFRIPFVRSGRDLNFDVPLWAGVRHPEAPAAWDCDFRKPCAIVIGSEGSGVSEKILARARPVRIPTEGVESLNAAVAAGILLYEAARQRRQG